MKELEIIYEDKDCLLYTSDTNVHSGKLHRTGRNLRSMEVQWQHDSAG